MLDELQVRGPRAVSKRMVFTWIAEAGTQRMCYERYLIAASFWRTWNGTDLKRPKCADPPRRRPQKLRPPPTDMANEKKAAHSEEKYCAI